jgi:endonuclease/exonuclease/phosphatase family metal-dependent hydrolase
LKLIVGTFNIYKDDGDFPNRILNLSKKIKDEKFHILCLQEDYNSDSFSSSNIINQNMGYYKTTVETRKKIRNNQLSSSNLTILSMYKPIKIERLELSEDKNEQRVALFVMYEINNHAILFVNTHLCHINKQNRIKQIEKIIKKIDSINCDKLVLCGDFNATPNSEVLDILQKYKMNYINNKITTLRGKIIDYICTKNIKIVSSSIVLKEFSDHFCVKSYLDLP